MNKNAEDKIYIPERVKNVQFNGLPISTDLAEFFDEHEIKIIADLRSINIKAMSEIIHSRQKPFPELRHYILAFQECESDKIILLSDAEIERRKTQEINQLNRQNNGFESILSKTIFIPIPARNWKISTLPISQQLIDKIETSGCSKLNDLHGVSYSNFSNLKSFERKDIIQLYAFLAQLQSEKTFPSIEALIVKSSTIEEAIETRKNLVADDAKSNQTKLTQNTKSSEQLEKTNSFKSTETIQTPPSLLKLPIEDLVPSDKLAKLLKKGKIFFVGNLNGISYYDLEQRLELDAEDVAELQSLMAFAKKFARYTENIKKAPFKRRENESSEDNIVAKKASTQYESEQNIKQNIENRKNFFQQISQKQTNEWQQIDLSEESATPKSKKLNLPELMNSINEFSDDLPQMEKEIFLDRFGGSPDEQILTYREIGERQQITTENAYQKYLKVTNWLKNRLENSADDTLKKIYDDCFSAVCPLTPKFLVDLAHNKYEFFQFPAAFYIRIFSFLMPEIPILPEIENQVVTLKDEARKIETEMETFLRGKHLPVLLSKIFNHLMAFRTNRETAEIDFFKAIQSVRFNLITTDKPNELFIELKNLSDN